MSEPPFDLETAHRWFAIECNNRVWDLYEQAERTPSEDEEMLHAAQAACHHWRQIGTPLHQLRALYLVTLVHAAAGHGETAQHYCRQTLELAGGDDTPAFDRAVALAAACHTARCTGDDAAAARFLEQATSLAADLASDERGVVESILGTS